MSKFQSRIFVALMHSILVAVPVLGMISAPAMARDHRMDWGRGRWVHDRHGGRLGWWWVAGGAWYFYERPYVYPQTVIVQGAPAPVVVQQAPPQPMIVQQAPAPAAIPPMPAPQEPVLYYCKATGNHYPETMSCPGGWSTHTATTPPQP